MVDKIFEMKNEILQQTEKEIHERPMERMDVERIGQLVDMIKDLAEAEEKCWKAQYYRTVTASMEQGSSGYGGTGSSAGYGGQPSMRQGYSQTSGYDQARMGYMGASGHTDIVEPIRKALQGAGPDEREEIRREILQIAGGL